MEQFSRLLVENWQLICAVVVSVTTLLIVLLKKDKINVQNIVNYMDEIKVFISSHLPEWINEIEHQVKGSSTKKVCVTELAKKQVKSKYSLTDDDMKSINTFIDAQIESILLTPTKKGGIGRETQDNE